MHLSLNNSLGKWILPKKPPLFSPEATNYFSRLDAAGDTTYVDYKQPLANYIDSLVSLGGAYWDTMESSTSFVGVGIQGVTVPLRDGMTVPTNNNFVAGDLDQLTGLKGDGSTKSIASGITTDDAGTLIDVSIGTYLTEQSAAPSNRGFIGAQGLVIRETTNINEVNTKSRNFASQTTSATSILGFIGHSRSANNSYTLRLNGSSTALVQLTTTVSPNEILLFRESIFGSPTDARLATYHAGPALDLATLEGLQETLLSEIRTAHAFVAAASYFSRLASAGDTTHVAYKQPLTNYISSLVALGGAYWDNMVSSCSFVGVGIQGITVPLRDGMPVPTQNNFVAADLDQLTGLKGGNTKELATGIFDNQFTDDNASLSVYATEAATIGAHLSNDFNNGAMSLRVGSPTFISLRGLATNTSIVTAGVTGLIGLTRNTDTDLDGRASQTNVTEANAGTLPRNSEIFVLSRNGTQFADSRLATYHLGSALDLATLEGLQATLLAEIAGVGFSTEAANYFSRLVSAGDTTFLAYRQPLANYIDSLVTLGGAYWDDMKSAASFVGVGIKGITVPLRSGMTVPTQNNFVASDLNQLTGLKGDASLKYLNTNVNAAFDLALNDVSYSAFSTDRGTLNGRYYMYAIDRNVLQLGFSDTSLQFRCQDISKTQVISLGATSGFVGASRSSSTGYDAYAYDRLVSITNTSSNADNTNYGVFGSGTGTGLTDGRIATYHIGPALDLATLEGLQDTLITEIAAI